MKIGDYILELLKHEYKLSPSEFIVSEEYVDTKSFFEVLVAVLLSQNTSDRNAAKALKRLREICGGVITPKAILAVSEDVLEDVLRPAGMYRSRARNIRRLAYIFSEEGSIEKFVKEISSLDTIEARRLLKELPGVGDKTADVILLRYFGKPVFPVDTHIARITSRLGFTNSRRYGEVSGFWASNTSPENYLELHLYLITHGRRTCKARNPLCTKCVIRELCRYYSGTLK